VRSIVRSAAAGENRFAELVMAIVQSQPFQMRISTESLADSVTTAQNQASTVTGNRIGGTPD
jgi:hypothetical protein